MKFIKKIKIEKIKNIFEKFKKLPRILAEHVFLTILGLLFLSILLGAIIFYQYSILALTEFPEVVEKPLMFKEKTCQVILDEWQARNKRFLEIGQKEYLDPFSP